MKRIFKNNIKVIIAFFIGTIISGSIVYGVSVASSSVSYTRSGSSVSSVEGALDELYEKADYIKFPPISRNIFAVGTGLNKAVCVRRSERYYCFGINNYSKTKQALESAYQDVGCVTDNGSTRCYGTDTYSAAQEGGLVDSRDYSTNEWIAILNDGSISIGSN